jgi:hypothetical protein
MSSLSMSPELAAVADQLVDANRPPSHDELRLVFRRAGVSAADPADGKNTVGNPDQFKRTRSPGGWND